MKKKVLIFTTSEGHLSIAQAVEHKLIDAGNFEVQQYFFETPLLEVYRVFYRYFPSLFFLIFYLFSNPILSPVARFFFFIENYNSVLRVYKKFQPDIVISTSLSYTSILEYLKRKFPHLIFLNVLPNPRTFNYLEVCVGADMNLAFDQQTLKDISRNFPKATCFASGWFVRNRFETKYNKLQIRQKLGLKNTLTFLIATGSEGTHQILNTLKSLLKENFPVQLIVACGKSKLLFEEVSKIASQSNAQSTQIVPLSFTNEIEQYMQAADVVIGKAGPNMVFESVACQTPFIATTHVSGLEDGNLKIIKDYNLGFVEEDDQKCIELLKKIIQNPKLIREKQESVKKLAEYNKQAGAKLVEVLQKQF